MTRTILCSSSAASCDRSPPSTTLARKGARSSPPAPPAAGRGRLDAFRVNPLMRRRESGSGGSRRCAAHRTSGLRKVAAVVEPALIEIGTELGKASAELIGVDAPGADFAEPGRIDDIADTGNGDELRGRRRVLAGPPFLADRAHAQLESRLKRVQQARLPRARRARENGMTAAQQVTQGGESFVGLYGSRQYLVIRGPISLRNRHRDGRIELRLVDDDCRRQTVALGNHQEAIHHP